VKVIVHTSAQALRHVFVFIRSTLSALAFCTPAPRQTLPGRFKMKAKLRFALMVSTLAMLAVIIPASQSTRAAGPWYVAPGGSDGSDCLSSTTTCATINGALNKPGFVAGDTILVATGVYTGTGMVVALINKNATLSGGWDAGFTTQSGTSTIDGQGARRGITVNSNMTAIVERLAIQNGTGNGGGIYNYGTLTLNNSTVSGTMTASSGGGIYNYYGAATLNNSTISGNMANDAGGGIYNWAGTLTLNNSSVSGNTADSGGGIHNYGTLTLHNSTVSGNTGGGIYNYDGPATLNNSTVSGNTGSGISNYNGTATLNNSTVSGNTGGGISNGGTLTLNNSTVCDNTTNGSGGGIYNYGTLTLNNSTISANTANVLYDRSGGGGIYNAGPLTLNNSTVSGNTANTSSYDTCGGGGIYNNSNLTLNNSTVSGNMANSYGGGIQNSHIVILQNSILDENTAGNAPNCRGGIGSAGYNLVGNTSGCDFSPTTGDLTDVDPKLGPLQNNGGSTPTHALLPGSPAIDAGNPAGCRDHLNNLLTTDQRGKPRLDHCDIGAYEVQRTLSVTKWAEPNPVRPGAQLTYTLYVTNTGDVTLTATITDTLPAHITPGGIITWTPIITVPGGVWTETVVVTVEMGYAGPLTNVVQVTTEEGAAGIYTHTLAPGLDIVKQAYPNPVQAGKQLTYTIQVTNAGNFDLHTTITDTLPAQLTSGHTSGGAAMLPGQPFTWTAFIPVGNDWVETIVATVTMGYAGPLTNVVQVTTLEGASGIYTATTQAQVTPALTVSKQANSATVRAGELLTYTIRITNTGNITLTGIVTDTLPTYVTPAGVQLWTLANLSPGNVWAQPVVVTVTRGYSGTLTNRVQVTTQEGATGETQVIVNAIGYQVYLPVVLK
jgi:uncharacterized repeat protein (TIGR01451 family)